MPVQTLWNDRLAWSGEVPLDYPGLNPVAATRFDDTNLSAGTWPDAVDPSHEWAVTPWVGTNHGVAEGPWGPRLGLNVNDPATEQGVLTLPHFAGLWPTSGRLLLGLWVKQSYTMTFNPLMNTRSGTTPVAYLSTYTTGRLRHNVYDASGSAILDQYEDSPWGATTDWQWVGMLVDLDAQTSQLAAVDAAGHGGFVGPVRALSGAVNTASDAPLEVFALPHASYWTGGETDEVLVAHPGASFDFAAFIERIRLGSFAAGQDQSAHGRLVVTDTAVTAQEAHTLTTGAEPVAWEVPHESSIADAIPYWSTDDGATWTTGELPETLDGLLRWDVPLDADDVFTELTLVEALPDPPVIDPIMPFDLESGTAETVTLTATGDGGPFSWTAVEDDPSALVSVSISGDQMTVGAGFGDGTASIDVTVTDSYGQTDTATVLVTVSLPPTPAPDIPRYAREPIIVGDGADAAAIIDPVSGVVVREVNGEHTLAFGLPVKHRHGGAVLPEASVEHAGIPYRVRRIETGREAGTPVMSVYCEEGFYDLAYAGQIDAREYRQVTALQAMTDALDGTGWSIGTVNVATRRTYAVEVTNPLELLRTVQSNHGGDLLFDSVARTVSLVTKPGRDVGVAFVYGRNLTESKRVVDTTSLVTRIYARNADGQTIASVNDGKAYVEDFTYTSEVREATYDFAAGTSPYTMLSMASATLANRAKPSYSYEFTVADLSWQTQQEVDRFDVGDVVTVVDDELGIREAQRIVAIEHDIVRPARTKITLSAKLRELGSSQSADGSVTTGSQTPTFDLVPYNLLKNGRFDGGLQHWGSFGVDVVEAAQGTGDMAARFTGSGERWIEQTVQPDNRDAYSLSFDIESSGPQGWTPDVRAIAEVTYEDGSTETITLELT